MPTDASKSLVTVLLPVRNERNSIDTVIRSILSQQTNCFELELLAIDGDSSDGTTEILQQVASRDPRVRVIRNSKGTVPAGLNLGIRRARGNYICVLGAHTEYAPNYISACLLELQRKGTAGCSGRVMTVPAGNNLGANLSAAVMSSRFACSSSSFRTHSEGFADTVPYPIYRADALRNAGEYDEELTRNQDNDINWRLRKEGYKLFVTWNTVCYYRAPHSIIGLMHYAFRNGYWNGISINRSPRSMSVRHFVPLVFVLYLLLFGAAVIASIYLPLPRMAALLGAVPALTYGGLACMAGAQEFGRRRSPANLLLPLVFFLFHIAYGSGTLWCFARKPFAPLEGRSQIKRLEPVG